MNLRGKAAVLAVLTTLALGFAASAVRAEGESESSVSGSNRENDRFGIYGSLYGDPYPNQFGINLAYNVYDFVRVNAGIGSDSDRNFSAASIGGGVKFLIPGLQLTPVVGINWASANVNEGKGLNIRGFRTTGNHFYVNAGLDWQTGFGLNLGAGYNQSLRSGIEGSAYVNAGFFI